MSDYAWTIVGGGIHGVHIAARLVLEAGISPAKICIVDPAAQLLSSWRKNTETTGMTHLRSPSVHNLGVDAFSLQHFAGRRKYRKSGLFAWPYNRPALQLFNDHSERVIVESGISACHKQSRVEGLKIEGDALRVTTKLGQKQEQEFHSERVVLAIGMGEQLQWPHWAPAQDPRVAHIFDFKNPLDFDDLSQRHVAIVGGGISAAQVALRLVELGSRVEIIARHSLRSHQFDSDPGWLGPKYMAGFRRERDYARRREMIVQARHRGSIPPDTGRALQRAIQGGKLVWRSASVSQVQTTPDRLLLGLASEEQLGVDRLLLATGFLSKRPGGAMIDQLILDADLPCAQCGYPRVDSHLRWHPRIRVSGPLAELELGPTSRNIAGARNAATRIISGLGCDTRISA